MVYSNVKSNQSIGRKIERIRELKGVKQETLATIIGVTQQTISKIEQSETVDDEKLRKIADALGVTIDAIKNFNEDAVINNINNFNDNSTVTTLVNNQFNPIEKIVELYEKLLETERKKVISLEEQIKAGGKS